MKGSSLELEKPLPDSIYRHAAVEQQRPHRAITADDVRFQFFNQLHSAIAGLTLPALQVNRIAKAKSRTRAREIPSRPSALGSWRRQARPTPGLGRDL